MLCHVSGGFCRRHHCWSSNVEQAFEAMFVEHGHAAHVLGDRVRAASRHRGPWPKVSVWHGQRPDRKTFERRGHHSAMDQRARADGQPTYQELIGSHTRRVWSDASGKTLVEAFSVSARFLRMHESLVEMPRAAPIQIPTDDRPFDFAGAADESLYSSPEASEEEERQPRYPLDPNAAIAAAFKAAGLPVPEIPTAPPGAVEAPS
jgi:hypothetical protein